MPYFRLRDNSVHLFECSPFSVGIFIILTKTTIILLFHEQMRILIGEVLNQLYMS